MDVDLQALRYFVAVADELHFARAAAALGISRQALSRAVVELEETLGVELFVRPSDQTTLTDAGTALRQRAATLLARDGADEPETGTTAAQEAPDVLRIAIMPGVTISKWTRVWAERHPGVPVEVVRTTAETQVQVLHDGVADVSFVRLPVDRTGLSLIPLYTEVPVVVVPRDHPATSMEEVSVEDLVDEHLLQDPDTVPRWRDAAAAGRTAAWRPLPEITSTSDAVALVAAGVGVLILPQSVARQHHRKDVTYRPVTDVAETQVGLAWLTQRTTPAIEDLVGIVRGRSARSSRSVPQGPPVGGTGPARGTAGRATEPSPAPADRADRAERSARRGGRPGPKAGRRRGRR